MGMKFIINIFFKGHVRYIFAISFSSLIKSSHETTKNFLFHLESSFSFWDLQLLELYKTLCPLFFYQIFILFILIFKNYEKCFFISSKKLFSFSWYSNFSISVFHSFSYCHPLIEDKPQSLRRHKLSKQELNNTFCLIFWEGKKAWHWNFVHW